MDYRKSTDVLQKELLSEIDESYEKSKGYFLWDILKAIAIGIKNLLEKLQTVADKLDVENIYQEERERFIFQKELAIKGKSKPLEQRQAVIKAKWRGAGKLTLLLIQRTLQSYFTGKIIITFQKRLFITMQGEKLEAIHLQDVVHTIEEVKPAHLGWNLKYVLPEMQSQVMVGAFLQSAISVHILPKTPSKWETETKIYTGSKVHVGIYLEVKEG